MNQLYSEFADLGLEILDFPSNDFNQEPLGGSDLKDWLGKKYGSTFLLMGKAHVNGPEACETFRWLRKNSELGSSEDGKANKIPWNFAKF